MELTNSSGIEKDKKVSEQLSFRTMVALVEKVKHYGKPVSELNKDDRLDIAEYIADKVSEEYAKITGMELNEKSDSFYGAPTLKNLLYDHFKVDRSKVVGEIAKNIIRANRVIEDIIIMKSLLDKYGR